MAHFFIAKIFKYHGLPKSIFFDKDTRMTVWRGLFENLGIKLNFSSTYPPQMDGQSEIVNFTMLYLLKNYVTKVDQRN